MDGGLGKGIVRRIKPDFMRQAVAGVVQEDGSLPPHGHVLPRVFRAQRPNWRWSSWLTRSDRSRVLSSLAVSRDSAVILEVIFPTRQRRRD